MNYDDLLDRQATREVRDPSEDEFDAAVDDVIEDEDLQEMVKNDPVLRKRFIYLRRFTIDSRAEDLRDNALDSDQDDDYVDDEDGDT